MSAPYSDSIFLKLCNSHLMQLYDAIVKGDVKKTYSVEHELTHEEECVACAYALKAHGTVREVLDSFLQKEGFQVEAPDSSNVLGEIRYWFVRIAILVGLLFFFINIGVTLKTYLLASRTEVALGSFGLVGTMLLTFSSFILIEQWFLE